MDFLKVIKINVSTTLALLILLSPIQSLAGTANCRAEAEIRNARIEHGQGWSKMHVNIGVSHDAPLRPRDHHATVSVGWRVVYIDDRGQERTVGKRAGENMNQNRGSIRSFQVMQWNSYPKPERIVDYQVVNTTCQYWR